MKEHIVHYKSGEVMCKGYCTGNKKVGKWIHYNKNGTVSREEYYTDGIQEGGVIYFDDADDYSLMIAYYWQDRGLPESEWLVKKNQWLMLQNIKLITQ